MVKEISLQNGMVALVDDEDFERVNRYNWTLRKTNNETSLIVNSGKVGSLNSFVMKSKKSDLYIHLDGNPLNFQKTNLKKVTSVERTRFRRGDENSTSKYRGVSWNKEKKKWRASIGVNKKVIFIGYFESEDEAAKAYNHESKKHFGELGFQNVIGSNNNAETLEIKTKPSAKRVIQRERIGNKSGYKGVYPKRKRWVVQYRLGEKTIHLGSFSCPKQAAQTYDQKAYELYGDKAILNFPELIEEYKQALQGGVTG